MGLSQQKNYYILTTVSAWYHKNTLRARFLCALCALDLEFWRQRLKSCVGLVIYQTFLSCLSLLALVFNKSLIEQMHFVVTKAMFICISCFLAFTSVCMIRNYHNHALQTNPRQNCEERHSTQTITRQPK